MNVPAFLRLRNRTLVTAAELILVVALSWLLAGLFWRIAAPSSPDLRLSQPAEAPVARSGGWMNAPGWFGQAQTQQTAVASTLSIKLVAVIAGGEGFSAAIFTGVGPTALAARPGDELQPGVKLLAVERDRARVDNGGRSEDIMLEGREQAAAIPAAGNTMPAPSGDTPADVIANAEAAAVAAQMSPQSAATGPQLKVTRGVMAEAMQGLNIADWNKGLAPAQGGGIRITNASTQPFASLLQLQNGDVLKQANGRALGDVSDMSLVYSQFSQLNQVTLQVLRNGSLVNLQYQIQP
ncbi:type II secretion system protein N [Chitinolyticbacter meiyuanensis]|uniref:type II secretion system protein N n=1 Tax=Chitinolyticbacter meiyuanensis TaxID=682798 RepID=UPI00165218BC|nr:type II secretion system protein N [Chitinolyticbacter meiyuanensis]